MDHPLEPGVPAWGMEPPTPESGANAPCLAPLRQRGRAGRRILLLVALTSFLTAACCLGLRLWAASLWRAGEEAARCYSFAEALEQFERCLKVWPNNPALRLNAARAARRADLLDRAEEHLLECEKHGVSTETACERFMLRAWKGDLSEVESSLEQLIRDGWPEAVLCIEALARGYLQTMRLGNAKAALDDLIVREPNHPAAHLWRGGVFEELDRTAEALVDYQRAVALAPARLPYRAALARALLRRNRPAEAQSHFQFLLRQTPDDPEVLYGAACCWRALARPADAREYCDRLLQQHPDHSKGWAERGLACADLGEPHEALRCLRRSFELEPGNYAVGFSLFAELRGQNKTEEANAVWKQLQMVQRDAERLREIVLLTSKPGNHAALRYEAGEISLRCHAEATALRWFIAALHDDPNHRPTRQALAHFYRRKGDVATAALFSPGVEKAP